MRGGTGYGDLGGYLQRVPLCVVFASIFLRPNQAVVINRAGSYFLTGVIDAQVRGQAQMALRILLVVPSKGDYFPGQPDGGILQHVDN
jgi:hypothetical protein